MPYNIAPTPHPGQGAFGLVPGNIGMPDPYGDLSAIYPNLSGTNAQVSGDILSKLRGELSPNTINAIQDAAAGFGVASGMPGSGLQFNKSLRDIGTTSEQVQQQGLQDYASLIPVISGTQTVNPALQAEIATQNSINMAAPDPSSAASYAESLFNKYLQQLNPAGGTGGGGGGFGGSFDEGGSWWEQPGSEWRRAGGAGGGRGTGNPWVRTG